MKGRLFTFGCSFTSYHWPTWANILGSQFTQFENWGCSGAGNQYIFNSIIECDLRNNFTKNDTVIVMWSGIPREDRYVNHTWRTPGNIFSQRYYNQDFIKKYADIRGYLIRDLATICAIDRYFEHRDCNFIMLAMSPIHVWNQHNADDVCDNVDDVLPFYTSTIDKIKPSVLEVVFNMVWESRTWYFIDKVKLLEVEERYNSCAGENWPSFERFLNKDFQNVSQDVINEIHDLSKWNWSQILGYARTDHHPTPLEHLMYVNKIFPEFVIGEDYKALLDSIEERILAGKSFTDLWEPVIIKRW